MKEKKIGYISLEIDKELLYKFRYICDQEGRSANSKLKLYIRNVIQNFEDKNGPIVFDKE